MKRGKLTFEGGEKKNEFILSQFMKALAIDDTCCFVDIIDECLKDMSLEVPSAEELVAPSTPEVKHLKVELYLAEGLEECLALTPNVMLDT